MIKGVGMLNNFTEQTLRKVDVNGVFYLSKDSEAFIKLYTESVLTSIGCEEIVRVKNLKTEKLLNFDLDTPVLILQEEQIDERIKKLEIEVRCLKSTLKVIEDWVKFVQCK